MGEDCLGAGQQFGKLLVGVVAGAEMGEHELFHPGLASELGGLRGGGVKILLGFIGVFGTVGGFVHHEVGASGKVGVAGHEPGVAEEHNIGAGLGWAHKVGATKHRAVVEGDVFATFQLPIAGPGLNPMVDELIHLQLPWLVGLGDAVGVRLYAMVKRGVAYGDGIIPTQGDFPGVVELHHLQGIANMRRRGVQGD